MGSKNSHLTKLIFRTHLKQIAIAKYNLLSINRLADFGEGAVAKKEEMEEDAGGVDGAGKSNNGLA